MKKFIVTFASFVMLVLLIKDLVVFFQNEMFDEAYESIDEYHQHMYAHLDNENKSEWYDEFNDQFVELSNFFDMCENLVLNNSLVTTAASAKSIPQLLSDEDFLIVLPYFVTDDLIEKNIIERDEDAGGFHFISAADNPLFGWI